MNALRKSLRQTLSSLPLVWLIYGITLVLGLLAALPFYNTLKVEDQNSLAVMNLLDGFDYTVFSDFMKQSGRSISPLLSVGRWLGILYVFLSLFFAGGILVHFSQSTGSRGPVKFSASTFWAACSHYVGRFVRLFGVTLLFVIAGAGIWLIAGSLVGVLLSDTFTERGLFWVGVVFFGLFALTGTLLLCIGDYAKVLMFREDEQNAFRAFGRAGRLVLRHPGKTYGLYWLLILIGTGLFGIYFLLDEAILMDSWLTIAVMLIIQQTLIFARVGLKIWSLGTAYGVYEILPKPAPIIRPVPAPVAEPIYEATSTPESSADTPQTPIS